MKELDAIMLSVVMLKDIMLTVVAQSELCPSKEILSKICQSAREPTLPRVTISQSRIPKDQTSDLVV
jgi:hypothetical protein